MVRLDRPTMTEPSLPDELDELLTAYALGALDEVTRVRLEELAAVEPAVRARLRRLTATTAQLVEPAASPRRGRHGVLARALRHRASGRSLLGPTSRPGLAAIHHQQAAALSELVAGLTDRELTRPTRLDQPVGAVLAHLVGQLERTVTALGDGSFVSPPDDEYDHWRATESYVERYAGVGAVPLEAVLADVNRRLVARLDALGDRPLGLDTPLGQALVKTFETWMHADDVRLALGRPVSVPDAGSLRVICGFAVGALPVTLALAGAPHPGAGREPTVTLVAEAHQFCRLFHRQRTVVEADVEISGDTAVAADVVAAIGVLAENT
jgi:uncharacterized protein (TIGR03083 family)